MIDFRELRAGNLVYDFSGNEVKLTALMISFIEFETLKDTSRILETPIPLKPEWLEKFGFKKIRYESDPDYELDYLYQYEDGSEKVVKFSLEHFNEANFLYLGIDPCIKIEHVHQLQNLYFALTSSELLLNESIKK